MQERDGCFLGLMSGTSLDAIDGALVDWSGGQARTLAFASEALPASLRSELLALQAPVPNELHRAALARVALTDAYAALSNRLLLDLPASAACLAIGAHGQTIRHCPDERYTLQLLDGALLAELTSTPVVCDFRSGDVAAGGQGAPLVPAFHAQVFARPGERRAIVNLGGIANVSLIDESGEVSGYDTGPANVLLDGWATRVLGQAMDADGALARRGHVDASLLRLLHDEPYFSRMPPKSTGRDLFNAGWLDERLLKRAQLPGMGPSEADIQATLLELTASTVADACRHFSARSVFLCGGGAFNSALRERIGALCAPIPVSDTGALGAPPQAVEAVAFAWLARQRLSDLPGNLPAVTGAAGLRCLGALYPAGGGVRT